MKKFIFTLVLCLLSAVAGAVAADKVENPQSCRQCGMDRDFFAHSRMLIAYADGTTVGECSINCAAIEMKQNAGRQVKSIMVGDYITKKLIDARKAIWVVGGRKSGVMTSEAKWAFAGKDAAEKFVKEYGGRITSFDEALDLAIKEND